jgi:hypothetical protein
MRFVVTIVTLLVGAAISAGLYWTFLNTPESTVWALAASAVLIVLALVVGAVTINIVIDTWSHGPSPAGLRRAVAALPSVIPALIIVLVLWWLTMTGERWVAMRSGQISAMFIARFGMADVSWLFSGVRYVAVWCRWVVAALLAFSLMTGFLSVGWAALRQPAWLRRALHPRAIIVATVTFVALVVLPWMYLVPWRPSGLPATSAELAFITTKLSLSALLFALGAAIIIREASRVPSEFPQAL